MAKAKKQEKPIEQRLEEALVLYEKTPYELPSNWCWVKFKSIADFGMGQTILSKELKQEGVPIYSASADGEIFGYINSEDNRIKLSEGDFVIAARGTIGSIKFISAKEACCTQTTMYMKPYNKEISKYLYYAMRAFSEKIFVATGATIPQLTISSLDDKMIPLAPFEEQKRIVEIIEKQFAKLDEARDLIQESLDTFVDRKSAILHRAFTGELTKNWREKSKLNYDAIIKKLKDCCKISSGGTPSRKHPEYYDGNIPWIKTGEIEWNEIYDSEEHISEVAVQNSSAKCYEPEVVLVAMYGMGVTRGRAAILKVRAATNQAVCVLKPNNSLLIKYLYYYFMCYYWDIREQAVGGNQLNLSGTIISQLEISIPSIEEQEEIVRILDSIFEKEDKSKELLDMLDKIDEMKKSILARAFRGQLGTFNPTDEPAIDLLRKILEYNNV